MTSNNTFVKLPAYFCLLIVSTLFLSSCATVRPPSVTRLPQTQVISPVLPRNNITHIVVSGETLWRISRMYNVPTGDIMRANNLSSTSKLRLGQQLIIPFTLLSKPAIPLYSCRNWSYIIVHHSATEEGDACEFDRLHRRKGWECIGYDFVIDNGTRGKADGEIEISPRWTKQENGAHCHAADMNSKGIGICLVGNFSKERISEREMSSLIYLVNILRKNYNIPLNHIMGHGQVPGARTECPGKYFSWSEFQTRLRNYN